MSEELVKILDNYSNEDEQESIKDIDALSRKDQEQIRWNKARRKRHKLNTKSRKYLAVWAAFVVSVYLLIVFIILFLNTCCLNLADAVLITLLGTTTLNVLGLMFIVLKGFFSTSSIN